jgi:hypothetical protein
VVVGLVQSHDPESYASGYIYTGIVSNAGQVRKRDTLVLQVGVRRGIDNPTL